MSHSLEHHSGSGVFMALFSACHDISSRTSFVDIVYPLLKAILPHERFVCGIATVVPLAVLDCVNVGFPVTFMDNIIDKNGRVESPLIRRWLADDAPVYFEEGRSDAFLDAEDAAWLGTFKHHGMRNMLAHGVKDLHGGATSYFCFGGLSESTEEHIRCLQMILPHLHTALRAHYLLKVQEQDVGLSLREREVLQLVCVGKTNEVIGSILGISPWTVKIHVRNFMSKLNVSTRGHAVAKAMKNRLVDI
jgi:DNA-binding CsgD family transcriptional regulator